jgi:hypothetical protein
MREDLQVLRDRASVALGLLAMSLGISHLGVDP